MNAAEHIVESYFRVCRGCFTLPDRKVTGGNNRQLDILAVNLKKELQFHIEISVTHQLNWCGTLKELHGEFERKFFGVAPEREGAIHGRTDFEKGKSYFDRIKNSYSEAGFSPLRVQRVWVCWVVKGEENSKPITVSFESVSQSGIFDIEVLSLRDLILPELAAAIGTANYDDEILRTLGFMKQREKQVL